MIPGLTTEEAQNLMLSVGTHHGARRLSPLEVAELFQKALDAKATLGDCARLVNLTPMMVSRFLKLLRLSPSVRHLVGWGRQTGPTVAFTSGWRLGDLDSAEQEIATEEIIANEMGKEEVRQFIQLRKRSGRRIQDCISEVLQMRPTVTRRYVFIGHVTDSATRQALSNLKQAERDVLLGAVMKELYGGMRNLSGRLGVEQFTILTDEQGAALLNDKDADFERDISNTLSRKVSR